jgi:hypothetical protein
MGATMLTLIAILLVLLVAAGLWPYETRVVLTSFFLLAVIAFLLAVTPGVGPPDHPSLASRSSWAVPPSVASTSPPVDVVAPTPPAADVAVYRGYREFVALREDPVRDRCRQLFTDSENLRRFLNSEAVAQTPSVHPATLDEIRAHLALLLVGYDEACVVARPVRQTANPLLRAGFPS